MSNRLWVWYGWALLSVYNTQLINCVKTFPPRLWCYFYVLSCLYKKGLLSVVWPCLLQMLVWLHQRSYFSDTTQSFLPFLNLKLLQLIFALSFNMRCNSILFRKLESIKYIPILEFYIPCNVPEVTKLNGWFIIEGWQRNSCFLQWRLV